MIKDTHIVSVQVAHKFAAESVCSLLEICHVLIRGPKRAERGPKRANRGLDRAERGLKRAERGPKRVECGSSNFHLLSILLSIPLGTCRSSGRYWSNATATDLPKSYEGGRQFSADSGAPKRPQ